LLSTSDRAVLVWLSEQYAARSDQLAALLDRSDRTARRAVARLREAGLVEDRALPYREGTWVWLTPRGQRAAATGFSTWRLNPALLDHIAAVNEVRRYVAQVSPASLWVPERQLARELDRGAHLPDAVVHTDAERRAIEVERIPKSRARTEAIVTELAGHYDGVVYYCAPPARRQLDELASSGRWPVLFVRDLPGPRGRSAR
jgi:DNA-binding MarR family transcriptional regulator